MGSRFERLLLFILFIFLISSCSIVKKSEVSVIPNKLTDEQKFDFTYTFFEANKYQLKGKFDLAIGLYNECLKIDNQSSAVYYNLAKIYLQISDFNVAEINALKAIKYNGNNKEYLALGGTILQKNTKFSEATAIFEKLIELDSQKLGYYLSLADVYLQAKDFKSALKIYNSVDNIFGVSEMISLQKNKIYIALNEYDDARNELLKLAKSNPSVVDYQRMIADFDVQFKQYDRAIIQYNSILEQYTNDGYSHIGLAECYKLKGNFEKALNEIKQSFNANDIPSDVKINLFLNIWKSAANDQNLSQYLFDLTKILVAKYPDNADVNTIYADFLLRSNELLKAKDVLRNILKKRKDKYMLWEQLILIENQFSDWSSMYKETNEALQYFPNQGFLYFFNGFSAFQLEKFDESLKSFEFGYKLITKDDPLRKDFLSFLAEAYHKNGDSEMAYSLFDELLMVDSENIMVLNNYAYYLSEDNIKLDKAKEMSFITVTKEPDNSTYLDTYAWILFRMNNYEEALLYIKKAVEFNKDSSAVIVEHFGDILFHNNNLSEAIEYWKLAKSYGKGSDLLDAKIEKQTYIE